MNSAITTFLAGAASLISSLALADTIEFNRDIRPLLSDRCLSCHGPDQNQREADLRLDLESAAKLSVIVPGSADESELIARITSTDPDVVMPPPSANKTLTPEEIERFRRWVEQGAVWQSHWAFEPARRALRPQVQATDWPQAELDYFVLARLETQGMQPSPRAEKQMLLRRVTFDLTGLPPTISEMEDFLADGSVGDYERVVDRLLHSPRYGEHLAAEWMQLARFADSNGYQNDFRRSMWPWRDWVVRAFNRNLPYDQFVLEQIAGDLLERPDRSQRIATGFNRNNRTVTEAGSIEEEWRVENNVDRVETTSSVFLALTMGCARCHDHKYDPISQRDFYSFFAFFNRLDEKGVYTETRGNTAPLIYLSTPGQELRLQQFQSELAAAKSALAEAEKQDGDASDARQRLKDVQTRQQKFRDQVPSVMIMKDREESPATYVLKRGAYDQPDANQSVKPNVPEFLAVQPSDTVATRLELARWIVDPNNPLTARVQVNRLWQRLFGVGIVKTAENFGLQSEPPSHPQLLDWLAVEFMESRWDIKALLKQIVMSSTYQQSSNATADRMAQDPENRWLARGSRFRLTAESIRDNALAVSGLLSNQIGGPSVKPYQPAGLWKELAGGANEGPYVAATDADLYRRSLYTNRKRTVPHTTMSVFDAPSFETCVVRRSVTSTPLQSLALLNDVTYLESSRQLAERMIGHADDDAACLAFGFRLATSRTPAAADLAVLDRALQKYLAIYRSNVEAARDIIQHGASVRDPSIESSELAAFTIVADILLNLDETISKP